MSGTPTLTSTKPSQNIREIIWGKKKERKSTGGKARHFCGNSVRGVRQ